MYLRRRIRIKALSRIRDNIPNIISDNSGSLAAVILLYVMFIPAANGAKMKQYYVTRPPIMRTTTKPACKASENSPLKVVMDRVCTMCHEMFSHENPNMRAECREDCYRTEQFKRCLSVFQPPRQVQKMLMEFY